MRDLNLIQFFHVLISRNRESLNLKIKTPVVMNSTLYIILAIKVDYHKFYRCS